MNPDERLDPDAATLVALLAVPDAVRVITEHLKVKEMGPADHIRTKHEVKTFVEAAGDAKAAEELLKRAREHDVQAVEKVLERWSKLPESDRQLLLQRMVPPLAARLQTECPPEAEWFTFLRDFLAAEYRRQHRKLG